MMFEKKDNDGTDDKMQRKLVRQLRAIRFWLGLLAVMMVLGFGIVGFMLFKAMTVMNDARQQLDGWRSQAENTLQLKDTLCSNSLAASSGLCAE